MWPLKPLAKSLLHSTGLLHGFRFGNRKAARILMYHRFSSDTKGLREQCDHVCRYYQPISLTAFSDSLNGHKPLPGNALIVTVDDGYRDFFIYAYPVFREYGIAPTVFLVSDFVDQKLWLWWNQIEYLFQNTAKSELNIEWPNRGSLHFSLASQDQKREAMQEIINGLLIIENSQRLDLVASVTRLLSVELPALPPPIWSAMTWDEVKQMATEGFEFGAHTKTHPVLSRISDPNILKDEINGSKLQIEQQLQRPVLHFCYPNGGANDFDDRAIEVVKQSGFSTAVTTERGMNMSNVNPFLLRRTGVEPSGDTPYFRELLAGVRVE